MTATERVVAIIPLIFDRPIQTEQMGLYMDAFAQSATIPPGATHEQTVEAICVGQLQKWQSEIVATITAHSEHAIAAELATHEAQVRQAYASQLQSIIGE